MGKGSRRRQPLVPREILDLRWALATGDLTKKEFERRMKNYERANTKKNNNTD